ncbi:MAG: hypothetical protein IJA49_05630 [Oscillospiraceae bacterium]|nr:hypothetical protein [Oscillospiraceae bacterium]
MKAWLLGIVAAAFLVSLLNALGGKGAGHGTRKLVGGILLTLAVFRPLGSLELTIPELEKFRLDADAAVDAGLEQADELRLARITERYCAYILSKAAALGLEPEVEVTVGENGFPEALTIRASASPGERQELTGIIVRELGIEKEAVVWIDPYQSSESMPSCEHTNIPS